MNFLKDNIITIILVVVAVVFRNSIAFFVGTINGRTKKICASLKSSFKEGQDKMKKEEITQ